MQRNDLAAYSKLMLKTEDFVIFEDAGYSGKNTDRPSYQKMMTQIRAGLFTHLLVWKIDRISRNLLDFAAMYAELKELGVIFVSKSEQFDTSTAMGEAMLKIILVFAELERNMTAERVHATMISRASQGLWNGGRVPFGYAYDRDTKTFSFREDEHELAVMIHDKYEELHSLVRESRYLNDKGYRTRTGCLWSPTTLGIILHNVFYCGDYVYNRLKEGDRQKVKDKSEWITVQDHHVAMISREQKERIILMLDGNSKLCAQRVLGRPPEKIHIFSIVSYCAFCGRPMHSTSVYSRTDRWRYSRYTCPIHRKSKNACSNQSITDLVIGETFFNLVLNLLRVQREFESIKSEEEMESELIRGNAFTHVAILDPSCVHELYEAMSDGIASDIVNGKSKAGIRNDSEQRKEKARLKRALERLQDLYLFSEQSMSEVEYIAKRQELLSQLEEVNEQIGMLNSNEWYQSITDQEFLQKAADFLLSQNLTNRNYVNYERMAREVGPEAIHAFVLSIIDSIALADGQVSSIVFRNGLSVKFIYK